MKNFRDVINAVSDIALQEIVEKVFEAIRSRCIETDRVRIRRVLENLY